MRSLPFILDAPSIYPTVSAASSLGSPGPDGQPGSCFDTLSGPTGEADLPRAQELSRPRARLATRGPEFM